MSLQSLSAAVWVICTYTGSLRGYETTRALLKDLIKMMKEDEESGNTESVPLPLIGRFKHQSGERGLVIPIASET